MSHISNVQFSLGQLPTGQMYADVHFQLHFTAQEVQQNTAFGLYVSLLANEDVFQQWHRQQPFGAFQGQRPPVVSAQRETIAPNGFWTLNLTRRLLLHPSFTHFNPGQFTPHVWLVPVFAEGPSYSPVQQYHRAYNAQLQPQALGYGHLPLGVGFQQYLHPFFVASRYWGQPLGFAWGQFGQASYQGPWGSPGQYYTGMQFPYWGTNYGAQDWFGGLGNGWNVAAGGMMPGFGTLWGIHGGWGQQAVVYGGDAQWANGFQGYNPPTQSAYAFGPQPFPNAFDGFGWGGNGYQLWANPGGMGAVGHPGMDGFPYSGGMPQATGFGPQAGYGPMGYGAGWNGFEGNAPITARPQTAAGWNGQMVPQVPATLV